MMVLLLTKTERFFLLEALDSLLTEYKHSQPQAAADQVELLRQKVYELEVDNGSN